ncbi:Fanconi anemia core complex-associated protein 20 [Nycticebus coucang]|uniref:Fanconi anemia core complex-associated protein 20 n=1 Tax=Nycticebus coucang TaxID=9470 RepID=UPI00234D9178|nr:Fanconi anemia core complex-associated protein 20 [Nycticebus coucang]
MEESGRQRLRLRRRRPPSGDGPPSGRPWFLQEGNSESERLWIELLRTVSPDLTLDGEPPPLPAFPGQESRGSPERPAPPEVFTVGPKIFSWTPFPPAPAGPGHSHGPLCGAGGRPESPTRSPQVHPAPEPRGTPTFKEQPAVEGALALQSCPMCQKDFAREVTQLDIDGHLAQCLAESTEDVW